MARISNEILGLIFILSYIGLLCCLWIWIGPIFLLLCMIFWGLPLLIISIPWLGLLDIYKIQITSSNRLPGKFIKWLLSFTYF